MNASLQRGMSEHYMSYIPLFHQVEPGAASRLDLVPVQSQFNLQTSRVPVCFSPVRSGQRAMSLHHCIRLYTSLDYGGLRVPATMAPGFVRLHWQPNMTFDLSNLKLGQPFSLFSQMQHPLTRPC